METPPIWSENLVRNFERIIEWCDAITIMCDISSTNYEHYMKRLAYKIKEYDVQHIITNLGVNFCGLNLRTVFVNYLTTVQFPIFTLPSTGTCFQKYYITR